MKKLNLCIIVLATLISIQQNCYAAGKNLYVRADIGAALPANKKIADKNIRIGSYNKAKRLTNSFEYSAGVGYYLTDKVRAEIAYLRFDNFESKYNFIGKTYGSTVTGTRKIKVDAALLNVYYDIFKVNGFTPYVGGGVGISKIHPSDFTITGTNGISKSYFHEKSKKSIAFKVTAGVSYHVSNDVSLDASYGYGYYGKFPRLYRQITKITNHGSYTANLGPSKTSSPRFYAHLLMVGVRCNW